MLLKISVFSLYYFLYFSISLANSIYDNCYLVKNIILQEAKILTSDNLLILAIKNQCLSKKNIANLLEKIHNFYHQKGYILTQASFVGFDNKKNILQLNIQEGKISKIFLDNSINEKHYNFFAQFIDKTFNIFELNSALHTFNKLNNINAKIKLKYQKNKLEIHIYHQTDRQINLNLGYDNLGNNFTGLNRYKLGFNLYQHVNFDYTYSTKNFHFYYNYLSSFFNQKQQNIKFAGRSYRHNFGINSLLFNNNKQQLNLDNSLTLRGSQNYLDSIKLVTSSQKLTIGQISLAHIWQPFNNVSTKIKPSFLFGLSAFNANKDNNKNLPKNQFRLLKLDGEISYRLPISSLSMLHKIESQKSFSRLFGAEQITVGGYNSVSAFRENIINGDNGYILHNKIIANTNKILPTLFKYNTELEIFQNYGYVNNSKQAEIKSGRLSDFGFKINISKKLFTASLLSSWAIHKSNMFFYDKKENYNLYFEISFLLF
jgi:hemolysin activation/secretion protein